MTEPDHQAARKNLPIAASASGAIRPKRSKLVLVACGPCKRRKAKCDGLRPVCGACKGRVEACTFEALPGVSRTATLKNEVARLQSKNNGLAELYWRLKNGDVSQAWALVEQIRSGEDALGLPRPDVHDQGDDHQPSMVIAGQMTPSGLEGDDSQGQSPGSGATNAFWDPHQAHDTLDSVGPSRRSPADPSIDYMHTDAQTHTTASSRRISSSIERPSASYLPGNIAQSLARRSEYDTSLRHSLQYNWHKIQEGFEIQKMCISEVFLCHESDAVQSLFAKLNAEQSTMASKAVLCEVCAVAATSGQYVRNLIAPELLDYWYDAARQHLDDCIESSQLSAIKVSALLGLYNLLHKSTAAISYFEIGLSLAARYRQKQQNLRTAVSVNDVRDLKRTQRSLTFCNGWLQATLGYVSKTSHTDNSEDEEALFLASDHDFVHKAVASIAVLKAATMRTLWGSKDASTMLDKIRFLQEELQDWYGRLPIEAQLIHLGTEAHIPLKTSIYYLHLLHLGAFMLMFRHCLAGVRSAGDRKRLSNDERALMNKTLHDGIMSAQHSARMIHMIREAAQSVRHCWITIFQSYVSGMILLYNAAQLSFAGFEEDAYVTSLHLASRNIKVLEFCGQLDPVARKFSKSLSTHYEHFREIHPVSDGDPLPKAHPEHQQPSDYLFIVGSGSTKLHDTSTELFEQLCNPYANENSTTEQNAHDAQFRFSQTQISSRHQMPPDRQDYKAPGEKDVRTTITAGISNLEDGYFVGSSEPNWWRGQLSAAAYSRGASTLETL